MTVHVTAHAVERYRERVADVPDHMAREAIERLVAGAAIFGAPFVKLGTGQRLVLQGETVITILPKDTWPGSLYSPSDRYGRGV